MADWIVDKTPLMAIKYDLLRQARVGSAVLGFLGLHPVNNSFVSLIPGGLAVNWLPEVKNEPGIGSVLRKISVLLLDPVTSEICNKAAAFQMGNRMYKKKSALPYDGISTPAEWVYYLEYNGTQSTIVL